MAGDQIADTMKLAIVSIEDKRFAEHNGVDWKGTLTGLTGYMSGDDDTRGGSTIEQQYVKNYFLTADRTLSRKAREILISELIFALDVPAEEAEAKLDEAMAAARLLKPFRKNATLLGWSLGGLYARELAKRQPASVAKVSGSIEAGRMQAQQQILSPAVVLSGQKK